MIAQENLGIISDYCRKGWRLIPLRSGQKLPAIQSWQDRASNDFEQIVAWLNQYTSQNIGIVTGEANHIFVLDIDVKKGSRGLESMKKLIETHGALPDTPAQRTASGGYHFFFKLPQGMDIRNSSNQIGDGLDIRGHNGFVVLSPSDIPEKGAYVWLEGKSILEIELAEPPTWLLDLITNPPLKKRKAQSAKSMKGTGQKIREGEGRNQALISFAGTLRKRGVEENAMLTMLHSYNEAHFDPPLDEDEVEKVWNSVQRYESGQLTIHKKSEAEELEELKQAMKQKKQEDPSPEVAPSPQNPLFEPKYFINVTDQQIHTLSTKAWRALLAKEKSPTLFCRNWEMVEIRSDENGQARIHQVNESRLRGKLDRCASWVQWKKIGNDSQEVPTQPPMYVVRDMLNDPEMPLPKVQGITHAPIYSPDGTLEREPGYLPQSKMYYSALQDCEVPKIAEKPTDLDVKEAMNFLLHELLIDFPFQTQASQVHALAMIFLPFVRQMIKGPTPLHLIDASRRGSGKSLLARVTHLIATGTDAAMVKLPKMEEETEKQIVSFLIGGSPMMVWDNVTGNIDRDSLNALLTSTRYSGRILGRSEMTELPNLATWIMTGKNVDMDGDIYRRVAWIRLQPPKEAKSYHHTDLMGWVEQHRNTLI